MNRFTSTLGGLLLGVAYGAFAGLLIGSAVVAFGSWIHDPSQGRGNALQEAWFAPFLLSLVGAGIGGLVGAVLGERSFRHWEQRQVVKLNPPLEPLPDERIWPPPPRHS